MKVKDIIKKINDNQLYIELINIETFGSYGIFKKNDSLLIYDTRKLNATIKAINTQYINKKRLLVLYIDR